MTCDEFTVTSFDEGFKTPWIGIIDLMASMKGLSAGTAVNMLKLMRHAPAWALGLYLLHPQGAMAAEVNEIAQQAATFPDFG